MKDIDLADVITLAAEESPDAFKQFAEDNEREREERHRHEEQQRQEEAQKQHSDL